MNLVGLSSRQNIIRILFATFSPTSHKPKHNDMHGMNLECHCRYHMFFVVSLCRLSSSLPMHCDQQIDHDEDDRCLAHVFATASIQLATPPLLDHPSTNSVQHDSWKVWGETKPVLVSSWVRDIPDPCII